MSFSLYGRQIRVAARRFICTFWSKRSCLLNIVHGHGYKTYDTNIVCMCAFFLSARMVQQEKGGNKKKILANIKQKKNKFMTKHTPAREREQQKAQLFVISSHISFPIAIFCLLLSAFSSLFSLVLAISLLFFSAEAFFLTIQFSFHAIQQKVNPERVYYVVLDGMVFFLLVVAAKSICLSMLLFVLPLFWHFVVFKPIIFGYYQIYTSYSSQDILCSRVSQLSFAIFSLPTLTGLIFRKTVICPLHIPVSRRLNSFLPSFSEKKRKFQMI